MGLLVTAGTVEFTMGAFKFHQLGFLLFVTCETGRGEIFGKGDIQGSMGVGMTAETSFKLVVRRPLMTLITGRNDFFDFRWMPLMTVLTTDFGFMGFTLCGNIVSYLTVAFDAVTV